MQMRLRGGVPRGADGHGDAAVRVDPFECGFVGDVVTEAYGAPTAERQLFHELRNGTRLRCRGRADLDYALTALYLKGRGQRARDAAHFVQHQCFELRCLAVVNGDCEALVFENQRGMTRDELAQCLSTPEQQLTRRQRLPIVNAVRAASLGLTVHAGHGLNYTNVEPIAAIAEIVELNIGHAIVAQALFDGFAGAVAKMKALMVAARA